MSLKIDVALLTHNRPNHLQQVLDSLCDEDVEKIFIFIDGPKDSFSLSMQAKINQLILTYMEKIDITVIQRSTNLGLSKSVIAAMSYLFTMGSDAVVLLEDDCVLLPGSKDYFFDALAQLSDNKKIRTVCGYRYPMNYIYDTADSALLLHRPNTWGWATWRDRWEAYEPDLRKIVNYCHALKLDISNFSEDLMRYSINPKYLDGAVDIWSVNWILLHYLTSTFALYTVTPLIKNIGFDGSGVNCSNTDLFDNSCQHSPSIPLRTPSYSKLAYYPENEMITNNLLARISSEFYPG